MLQDYYNNVPTVFLAHGYVAELLGKTINGVLMHSKLFNVVSLIDREKVGIDTSKCIPGVKKQVPVVESLSDALEVKPKPEVIILMENSINTSYREIKEAIRNGLDIINPGFNLLENNPEIISLAKKYKVKLFDLRKTNISGRVADGSILNINSKVVYVAGTDCGLGKRTAAYELVLEAKKRGIKAAFAATGQTGIMLGCDGGIVFDTLTMQFASGAVEELITDIDKNGFDLIFLEGQASMMHYAFSCSVSLLHASNPHAIVLVHDQKRDMHVEYGNSPLFKMCKLKDEIQIIEGLSLPGGNQFKVTAIATIGEDNIKELERLKLNNELQDLPIADARMEGGPAKLLDAVLKHLEKEYHWRPTEIAFS